jgi:hypothetical protein
VLFVAGSKTDQVRQGRRAAALYTIIETAKMSGLDVEAYLADVVARIADHPINRIDELLPWYWRPFLKPPVPPEPRPPAISKCQSAPPRVPSIPREYTHSLYRSAPKPDARHTSMNHSGSSLMASADLMHGVRFAQ